MATPDTTPATAKNATIIASYAPAPPGVTIKNPAIDARPYAIKIGAGLTTVPSAQKVIKNSAASARLNTKPHKNGLRRIFFSRRS
ncbi:hypothetical protein D3C85_1135880 [compost metagenome]